MKKLYSQALSYILAAACISAVSLNANANTTVFSSNFDTTLPTEITPGVASLQGVQGYAGYGPLGNQFGGSFLRSQTANVVTLSLTGLQAHSAISLDFLFAAIDSLDGTGTFPSGDYFKVTLDGAQIFRESFANAVNSQVQSYTPPTGVQLARHVDLGFGGPGGFYRDSAYHLSGSTATFTFQIEGVGNQNLSDESWAMDNLKVSVVTSVPEPETYAMLLAGLGLIGTIARRRRAAERA